jgi:hypothetical protein
MPKSEIIPRHIFHPKCANCGTQSGKALLEHSGFWNQGHRIHGWHLVYGELSGLRSSRMKAGNLRLAGERI